MSHPIAQVDLNNYKLISTIGNGSYGKVFLVEKTSIGKYYAAKESYKEYLPDDENQEFEKELFSLHKVQNPAIVKIYGFSLTNFQGKRHPVMIQEYLPNSSLDKALEKNSKKLTSTRKLIIILGISLGMKSLHSHGIVHRDLKPSNILLDEKFYPYICDFGISYITNFDVSDIKMKTPTGTLSYQAPELILGDDYSDKVDVYSFALIAYQIITGEKPNKNYATQFKMQQGIINGERPDTSMISNQRVKNFIELCWSSEHSKRPSFNDIVEEYLDKEYINFFHANKEKVDDYVSLFDDELKKKDLTPKIVKSLLKKAKAGDSNAYLTLASLYDHGEKDVEVDQEKACLYYEKACELGNSEAMIKYTQKLIEGIGIQINNEKAEQIYRRFVEIGDPRAMYNLAIMLYISENKENNKKEYIHYFKTAADNGHVKSMLFYGDLVYKGDGVRKNKKEASMYYKMAADKGNVEGMLKYTKMLHSGDGIPKNRIKEARYLEVFADKGNAKAAFIYATILEKGDGIDKDLTRAAKYMKIAADNDVINAEAQFKYGLRLYNGDGVKCDKKESLRYINESSKQNYDQAIIFLEKHSFNGLNDYKSSPYKIKKEDEKERVLKNPYEKIRSDLPYSPSSSSSFNTHLDNEKSNSDNKNSDEYAVELINNKLSIFLVFVKRMTSTIFDDVAQNMNIKINEIEKCDIIIYDGLFTQSKYHSFIPSKYVNKIPGLSNICLKKNLFKCLYAMKNKFPSSYKSFIPMTFCLPEEKSKFQDTITQFEYEDIKWVLKKNSSFTLGIELVSDPKDYIEKSNDVVIQQFISPYLINGHKFDLRFYLLIANLDPLTVYIYKDGLAYFCREKYSEPTTSNRNAYAFNKRKKYNKIDHRQIKLISSIKKHFSGKDNYFCEKLKRICALSVISIFNEMKESAIQACKVNDEQYDNFDETDKISALNRFFNLIAIDFLVDENLNPFVIGINDNPGMMPLNEFDEAFKFDLIKSEYELIASLLNKPMNSEENWDKILPSEDQAINFVLNNLDNEKKKRRSFKPNIKYI